MHKRLIAVIAPCAGAVLAVVFSVVGFVPASAGTTHNNFPDHPSVTPFAGGYSYSCFVSAGNNVAQNCGGISIGAGQSLYAGIDSGSDFQTATFCDAGSGNCGTYHLNDIAAYIETNVGDTPVGVTIGAAVDHPGPGTLSGSFYLCNNVDFDLTGNCQ